MTVAVRAVVESVIVVAEPGTTPVHEEVLDLPGDVVARYVAARDAYESEKQALLVAIAKADFQKAEDRADG